MFRKNGFECFHVMQKLTRKLKINDVFIFPNFLKIQNFRYDIWDQKQKQIVKTDQTLQTSHRKRGIQRLNVGRNEKMNFSRSPNEWNLCGIQYNHFHFALQGSRWLEVSVSFQFRIKFTVRKPRTAIKIFFVICDSKAIFSAFFQKLTLKASLHFFQMVKEPKIMS